ncbi:MAG: hypothetical protein ACTFAK_06940 [Candidatus Electronema sp. VV]
MDVQPLAHTIAVLTSGAVKLHHDGILEDQLTCGLFLKTYLLMPPRHEARGLCLTRNYLTFVSSK